MFDTDKRSLNNDKWYASNIIFVYINNSLFIIIRKITLTKVETDEGIEIFMPSCEVEEKTFLDLQLIIDISNSMNPRLNQA